MTIYVVGGYKGGIGKTTCAINLGVELASRQRDVLMVDTDTQGSLSAWTGLRNKAGRPHKVNRMAVFGDSVIEEVRNMESRFDDIIIDTPGRDCPELRAAATVAQVLITPIEGTLFDSRTHGFLSEIIKLVMVNNPKLGRIAIPSRIHTNGSRREKTLSDIKVLVEMNLKGWHLTNGYLSDRQGYKDMLLDGRAGQESSDTKVRIEIRKLFEELLG